MSSTRRLVRLVLLCAASSLLVLAPSLAEEATADLAGPAFSLPPSELLAAASKLPAQPGEQALVLLEENLVHFDDDGRRVNLYRLVYRVDTPAGVENWARTNGVYDPWHQDRPTLKARVVAPDGTETWLDPATISDRPLGDGQANVSSDRMITEAPLPVIAIGSVVEETVETRDTRPSYAPGTVHATDFARFGTTVQRRRLVIDAPESLPLRTVTQRLDDLEPERETADGRQVVTFDIGPLDAIESIEQLAPGDEPLWPRVVYSIGESWADIAAGYGELVTRQLSDADLRSVVDELTTEPGDRDATIRALLAWLHDQVRYTAVQLGDAAIVPRTPEETLTRGYGDCKDKSTLLVGLLEAAGIPARVALLSVGPGPDVVPELPGLGLFDHAIVVVPGEPALWIDPTNDFVPLGELPTGDQGRLALVADASTRELTRTPVSMPEDNRFVEVREVFLAEDLGGARIVETSSFEGAFAHYQRASIDLSDPEDLEKGFEEYMTSTYSADALVDWSTSDPKDLDQPFEMRLEAEGALFAYTDLHNATIYVAPDALLRDLPETLLAPIENDATDSEESSTKRRTDLEIPAPYIAEHRYRIAPPAGYRAIDLPESETRSLGPATLTREVAAEGSTLLLTFRFDTGKRRLTPDEIMAVREAAQEVFDADVLQLSFEQVAESHLAAGEIRKALDEIGRLVAAAPERALSRSRRARVLVSGGLGAAARREADAAVALDEDLFLAHQAVGLVHLHDLVGRPFRPGMDHQRAEAAFRKAAELDSDGLLDRQNLATLLEHDENGIRFGESARLDEAIEIHAGLCDDPDSEHVCLEENLLLLLARTGRFDELHDRVSEPGRAPSAFALVAEAVVEGPDAAARTARRSPGGEPGRALLAEAGQALMQLRRYPEASALFRAAARGADNPAQVLQLADLLGKARRLDELELDPDDPVTAVRSIIVAVVRSDLEAAQRWIASDVRETLEDDLLGELRDGFEKVERQASRAFGMTFEGLMELGLAAAKPSVDGSDEVGYRVRLQAQIGDSADDVSFVVREPGGYRVAASDSPLHLGLEALRRVRADELEAARQWLDWAHELVGSPPAGDPWAGEPFFHLWTRGQEADAEAMRLAAASLLVTDEEGAETALPMLEAARERLGEDTPPGVELALSWAFDTLDRPEDVQRLARGWLDSHPQSKAAFWALRRALADLERWQELEHAARARLELLAEDETAIMTLADAAHGRGDLAEERRWLEHLVDSGRANGFVYNELAWADIVADDVTETTLERAQRAVALDATPARLHTLATAYATLGRSAEAREILYQAMAAGDEEPRSDDWYVWGLIAESYGLEDAAREAYARVERPEERVEGTSWSLTQRRLAALDGASEADVGEADAG